MKVGNLFQLHDTHGFPLTEAVAECARRGLVPDLAGFCRDAKKAGWPWVTVERVLREASSDSGVGSDLVEVAWVQALEEVQAAEGAA